MGIVSINNIDGYDIIQYQPQGVCAKMMQIKVKDDIVHSAEFVGGCNGNLSGIGILVIGMAINDVIEKLQGLPCGSRPTSCPDQLTKGLEAYLRTKQEINV